MSFDLCNGLFRPRTWLFIGNLDTRSTDFSGLSPANIKSRLDVLPRKVTTKGLLCELNYVDVAPPVQQDTIHGIVLVYDVISTSEMGDSESRDSSLPSYRSLLS